ncbi:MULTISPECIES: ABC transporter permease [Lactobacillus]|uniref:ABC transporter permease n=1 Tax=Lactobacillus xujianguonis TaxID=2495899 RepID=A0A437SW43_9LACO|nr:MULTISPECIES: ABC transporter permease [Lactobacillus]RVU71148.1 ABC transporter permease [Lactobacillus xujianguonis]RVU77495.1 ABC transporter permease [Lactobacillus xujianguonis]
MKYLNLKLIRDVRKNWTQFFSVFLMAFLSVLLFVGLQGAWKGLDVSLHHYSRQSRLSNYWIRAVNIQKADLNKLKAIPGVTSVSSGIKIQTQSGKKQITIEGVNTKRPSFTLVKGNNFSQTNGIWIDKEYAIANNIKIGDQLPLKFNHVKVKYPVKGIIQSASKIFFTGSQDYIAPNHSKYGYAYLPEVYLKKSFPNIISTNFVTLSGHHANMRQRIEQIFGKRLMMYDNRSTLTEVATAFDRVTEIKNLSYLFSFIFILLAILAMFTTIRRLIADQTSEIAVLKALGFSNQLIGLHYGSFGLLVGGLGSLTGAIFSPVVSLFVLSTQKTMFSLPKWQLAYTYTSLWVLILVIAICVLSAYFAAYSAMRGLPADFLRGDSEKEVHHIFLERFPGIFGRFSYGARWIIRDAFFNKIRILMGIVGVAGGMMLMIAGIGMPQSINHLVDKTYTQDYDYAKRLTVNDYASFKNKYPQQKGQWLQVSQAHFSKDDGYNRYLTILGKGHEVKLKTVDGKEIKSGGIYLTHGFAEKAHIKKGEKLRIKTFGGNDNHYFKVKGIIDGQVSQGAYLTAKTWKKAKGEYQPTTLLIDKNTAYPRKDVVSIVSIGSQQANANNFVNNLMGIFALIIGFAVVLIVVVLYNLGSLGFVERYRDYATLRVLGIHKKELKQLTFVENVITTFIGWLVGIPAGIWFLGQYVATFTTIKIEYVPYINWITITFASTFVWICSLSTTIFLNNRIKKIDMVQALKGVE